MSTSTILAIVLTVTFPGVYQEKASQNQGLCDGVLHYGNSRGENCCDSKGLPGGLLEKYWQACLVSPTDKSENYTSSQWRIYSCVLSKSLPTKETTITFTKFGEIMTHNYPKNIQKDIMNQVKAAIKSSGKKDYMTTPIKLTDYYKINRIRVAYFNIEKAACGLKEKGKAYKYGECDQNEEVEHRGGTCCQNISIPVPEDAIMGLNAMDTFSAAKCPTTMSPMMKKLGIKNKSQTENFQHFCDAACFLVTKKLITVDALMKMDTKTKVDVKDIVKLFVPKYASEAVENAMQKKIQKSIKLDEIMKETENDDPDLGNKTKMKDIFGCLVYRTIVDMMSNVLLDICQSP